MDSSVVAVAGSGDDSGSSRMVAVVKVAVAVTDWWCFRFDECGRSGQCSGLLGGPSASVGKWVDATGDGTEQRGNGSYHRWRVTGVSAWRRWARSSCSRAGSARVRGELTCVPPIVLQGYRRNIGAMEFIEKEAKEAPDRGVTSFLLVRGARERERQTDRHSLSLILLLCWEIFHYQTTLTLTHTSFGAWSWTQCVVS